MVVTRLLWWCGDDDDDVMMRVAAAAETGGGGGRRVEESGCGDRIDPVMRSVFGVGRKSPPEKFSGGGRWWPAAVGRAVRILREREEGEELYCILDLNNLSLNNDLRGLNRLLSLEASSW
ncbi:hypothetical protein Tco_1285482 [Tanacetum coccineum]